jgi:ABC-type sugar transport system ATPase subunit
VENLSKHFGGVRAVNNVSFSLYEAQVMGLVGDNGAGKSTLINMISGVVPPSHGKIFWCGQELSRLSPRELRELGIETIYQDLSLAENLDVPANIFLGRELTTSFLGLFKRLDHRQMKELARAALERVDVDFDPSRPTSVRELSGGQRQAVAIIRSVYWHARLLIMDEPTAALGVKERKRILDLMRSLKEGGVTIILVSHSLPDVFAITDRILVMRHGMRVADLVTSETSEQQLANRILGIGSETADEQV